MNDAFESKTYRRALAKRVLCVAETRIEGTWKAYCDAVHGVDHKYEGIYVLTHGNGLPEDIAKAIFPFLKDMPYAK